MSTPAHSTPARAVTGRPGRVVLRGLAVAFAAASASALLPGTAAADVTVAASRAEAGARDVTITFRVTNADPAVPTTRLQVFLPTARPLLGVRPTAPAGWAVRVDTAVPAAPPTVDGAPVPEIATAVTWEGGTLAGSGYAAFPVDVARLPDGAGPLRFRVVQTYAGGATEEWSDLVPYGAPAPAHPALVVPYGTTPVPQPGAGPEPGAPRAAHHHGGAADVPAADRRGSVAGFAGVVGAVAALVAAGVTVLGRRQRRLLTALRDAGERR